MESGLGSLAAYGSDEETTKEEEEEVKKTIVTAEEVYAEDMEEMEPAAKRSKVDVNEEVVESAVDSFLAEIGEDLEKIPETQIDSSERSESGEKKTDEGGAVDGQETGNAAEGESEENIDGEEIPFESLPHIPTTFESAIVEAPVEEIDEKELEKEREEQRIREEEERDKARKEEERKATEVKEAEEKRKKEEEQDLKLPYFKLANRCAIAMKSTLNVRSVQMDEYRGFRVYLRYDDVPICLLSSSGQHESEITARRTAVKDLVDQMLELGVFPPNAKKILAEKITTVDKMIEVVKPVLSYLKFQLSDQRYQRMLRDDTKMSVKADCTQIQLQLIAALIDQMKFFTYRFYAEPTNNPWLHLAPANSVAPSAYTTQTGQTDCFNYGGIQRESLPPVAVYSEWDTKSEPVYGGGEYVMSPAIPPPPPAPFPSSSFAVPPPLAQGMKLRIIEDATNASTSSFFSLPPPPLSTYQLPSASGGFQSQFVRTVSVVTQASTKEEAVSAALRINVPKHDVVSEIVERTIGALGWTERNDTIMIGMTRKRAYLWVDEVPIAILGSMGESEKLSEAVSSCTHELMEQLCAWSLFPLDMVSQICRNKDHLNPLLYSMGTALTFISTTLREDQYMSLHRTQGMARVPLEAPASHQAIAIAFRCRVKSFMDKFWETHTIKLGPLIPLPKLEQWERTYFYKTESMPLGDQDEKEEEIYGGRKSAKSGIDLPWTENGDDAPVETEEYL